MYIYSGSGATQLDEDSNFPGREVHDTPSHRAIALTPEQFKALENWVNETALAAVMSKAVIGSYTEYSVARAEPARDKAYKLLVGSEED